MTDERNIAQARAHMTAIAVGLVSKLGAMNAAGVLVGGAVGILLENYGAEKAAEYLRELADAIESGEGDDIVQSGRA